LLEFAIGEDTLTIEGLEKARDKRCKASADEFLDALTGVITPLQRELFAEVVKTIAEQTRQIERLALLFH